MDFRHLEDIISGGETSTVEFKSWIKAANMRERINLAVDELIAFSNAKGGTVFFGIEDDGEITGCTKYDCQNIIESIYDKTRPSLFAEIEEIDYKGHKILAISVQPDGITHTTTDGRCLKRLGKNTKPYYPEEMSHHYTTNQIADFTGQIALESSANDIDFMEVYKLKEKLRIRDSKSTLPDMEDMAFLKDLGLVKEYNGQDKLTIAGILFVGKEQAIDKLLPQAEVIYLHYGEQNTEEYNSRIDMKKPLITILDRLTEKIQNDNKIMNVQVGMFRLEIAEFSEKVFQEALLNALSHRDYQSMGAVYVKHYPDKIVIENPGGFLDGITEKNIITHPSAPRNKLVAETLQRLKYVQRTGQGVDIIFKEMVSMGKPFPEYRVYNDAVALTIKSSIEDEAFVKFVVQEQDTRQKNFSLAELMILRFLSENKRIKLSEAQELTQLSIEDARRCCNLLVKMGLIETVAKNYMLTAKVYEAIKTDVSYTQDQVVRYIKAKDMILEYLSNGRNTSITNEKIQVLCGYTRQQARMTTEKMRSEGLIELVGKGRGARYVLK